MLTKIKLFFANVQDPSAGKDLLSVEVATSVLLYEVMNADNSINRIEKHKVSAILQKMFSLSEAEVEDILAIAEDESYHANDFYRFTSLINQHFELSVRQDIVKLLWQVAYSDGHLDIFEEHIIRKIADLLHLRHEEYIQCKLAVQQQLGI